MNLSKLTLELAEMAQGTETVLVTDSDIPGKRITVNSFSGITGEYTNGSLWFINDGSEYDMRSITHAVGNTITLNDSIPDTVKQAYICAGTPFTFQHFISAVNFVLASYPITATDNSLQTEPEKSEYILPSDINDVRRVKIGDSVSHYWVIIGDRLFLYGEKSNEIKPLSITYVKYHDRLIKPSDCADRAVRMDYVKYMSYLYLFRNQVERRHGDNPISDDLMQEAKAYEQLCTQQRIPGRDLMIKDLCYPYVPS